MSPELRYEQRAEVHTTVAPSQLDDLNAARGVVHGTWIGLLMWAVVIGALLLLTGCAKDGAEDSALPYSTPGDRLATDYALGRGPSEIPDLRRLIEGTSRRPPLYGAQIEAEGGAQGLRGLQTMTPAARGETSLLTTSDRLRSGNFLLCLDRLLGTCPGRTIRSTR